MAYQKTIFVVDDNDSILFTAREALHKHYSVFTLPSAPEMFELLENVVPDLILLDIMMPGIDGLEAMELLKADSRYCDIPVIFLTSRIDADSETRGFKLGAVDYISKPFVETVLFNRVKTHLDIDGLIRERTEMLVQKTETLEKLQNSLVSILANMVENRDKMTGRHIERTTRCIRILLDAMRERGVYAEEVGDWAPDVISSSCRLHDIGKIVVSDLILNKEGSLTPEEYELMKTHTIEGERIIDSIMTESGDEDFLKNAKLFAGYHHERWDGSGYPYGLSGTDIPLQGRMMAVVDVYDAVISERPYKPSNTHENAVEIIRKGSGLHFDPKIVDVFLDVCGLFPESAVASAAT
jgi:putative two-component system response regulator